MDLDYILAYDAMYKIVFVCKECNLVNNMKKSSLEDYLSCLNRIDTIKDYLLCLDQTLLIREVLFSHQRQSDYYLLESRINTLGKTLSDDLTRFDYLLD